MTLIRKNVGWSFRYLPELMDREKIKPTAITHVGAHVGEEVPIYRECGFEKIVLVEPHPEMVAYLRSEFDSSPDITIVTSAVGLTNGKALLYTQDRSDWSSLDPAAARAAGLVLSVPLGPATPVEVDVETLPGLQARYPANVLVLDCQGLEMPLLRTADLAPLDLVVVETSNRHNDSAALYRTAVQYMQRKKWVVIEKWHHDLSGYSDTLFMKDKFGS
jgi:FkbM family methyltransferase